MQTIALVALSLPFGFFAGYIVYLIVPQIVRVVVPAVVRAVTGS
jgi:hypothetical protein